MDKEIEIFRMEKKYVERFCVNGPYIQGEYHLNDIQLS